MASTKLEALCNLVQVVGDCEVKKADAKVDLTSKKICTEILSEVMENALDLAQKDVGDTNVKCTKQKPSSSKSLIGPNEIKDDTNYKPIIGVGDQLITGTEEILKEPKVVNHPVVEKKNRLTDLVRNSKQILAKFLNESKPPADVDVKDEKVIKVIDLDCASPQDQPFKVTKGNPENNENAESVDETKMDNVCLSSSGYHENPFETDETTIKEMKKSRTLPFASNIPGCSVQTNTPLRFGIMTKCRTLRSTIATSSNSSKKDKDKKWNIGTKFLAYLRKQRQERKRQELVNKSKPEAEANKEEPQVEKVQESNL